jgi:gametolysin peptidase M11
MFNPTRLAVVLLATSVSFAAHDVPRKVALRGTLSVVQEDDFSSGRTKRVHSLFDDATGERFTLRSSRLDDLRLRSGSRVVVRGEALGQELVVGAEVDALQVVAAADAPAMESRKAVVIVADFSDSAVSCTDASIAGLMWTGSNSVDGLYQAASFGQVSVPNDVDNNGSPDVFRVTIPNSISEDCDAYGWAAAAENAAIAAGASLGLYQHKVIVLPSNAACGWAGLGNVGCSGSCRAWVKTCDLQDVYAHEIGHNLDLAHASTDPNNDGVIDCEYCDMSDIMGYGGVGWRLFSGPKEHQKNWTPSANVQTATGDGTGTYVISPLYMNPATAPYPQILRIQKPDSGDWYYLTYRLRQGYDSNLSTNHSDRVNIHRYSGSGYSNSRFIVALQDTQYFDDNPNGMRIRQVSHDAVSVTLQVTTTCNHVPPTLTLSPAVQTGAPGTQLNYTATVTNRDPLNCGIMVFNMSAAAPAGFITSFSSNSLELSPGVTGSVQLRATSPASELVASENTLTVSTAGVSATAKYNIQVQPNTPPTTVKLSGAVRKGSVNLSWTASSDANGISAYRVMRNGVQIASIATRTFADKPTVPGTYDYTIVAVDSLGGTSTPSNAFRYTLKPPRR